MAEELKARPFCGGAAKRITPEDADNFGGDVITCSKCECCTRVVFGEKEGLAESWNTRAQLPSQGGEAVAEYQQLSRYGNWDRIDKVDFDLGMLGSCPEKFRALYTHPADQVADDLTMVKVSRELLQDLRDLAFDQVEHHRAAMGAYKQTRQSAMDSVLAQADALLRS